MTILPDEPEDSGWDYGVPLADVQRLLARWKNGYDWRKYEKELNDELPQFQTDIDVDGFGILKIHFVHKKSEVPGAIPLLFVHGSKRLRGIDYWTHLIIVGQGQEGSSKCARYCHY